MIYDCFDEKTTIKSRDLVSQPTWGGPGYVGKTGTHSIGKREYSLAPELCLYTLYYSYLAHLWIWICYVEWPVLAFHRR